MEHIADFFRESGQRDRHFEVDEARWDHLAKALDLKKKKRWLPLRWIFGGLLLSGAGLGLCLTILASDTRNSKAFSPIKSLSKTEASALQQVKPERGIVTPLSLSNSKAQVSQGVVAGPKAAPVTDFSEPVVVAGAFTIRREEVEPVLSQRSPLNPAAQKMPTESQPMLQEVVVEGQDRPVIKTGRSMATIQILAQAEREEAGVTQLRSMTSSSMLNAAGLKKRTGRKPYARPMPMVQRQAASATTTLQSMLGAQVYGANMQGEEINVWER